MTDELVSFAVDLARQKNCEYAEARFQRTTDLTCFIRNGEAQPAAISDAEGIGVRILFDGALAFGATNLVSKRSVTDLVDRLVKNAKVASSITNEKIRFSGEESYEANWSVEEKKKLEDVSAEFMISFLKDIDRSIPQSVAGVSFPNRNLIIFYSIDEKFL